MQVSEQPSFSLEALQGWQPRLGSVDVKGNLSLIREVGQNRSPVFPL